MASFDHKRFVDNPSEEIDNISYAKKDEIIALARHFHIHFQVSMRKREIKRLVIEGLISQEEVSEEARNLIDPEVTTSETPLQIE